MACTVLQDSISKSDQDFAAEEDKLLALEFSCSGVGSLDLAGRVCHWKSAN